MEESETDAALMKQVGAGNIAQVAVLFERYHLPLFRYLLGLTGNRAVSEDLVQEVFLRVIKHAGSYDTKHPFAVWIYGMGRNAYFDLYRKQQREVPDEHLEQVRSRQPLAEETIGRQQDLSFLHQALQALPADKREVLILSRFQHLGYDEISKVLGCQVGTVKTRVFRALQELRKNFSDLQKEKVYDV